MTPAIQFLEAKKIPFEVVKYEHLEKGARFAAGAIGMPVEQTIKTLVVDLSGSGHLIVLMPGNKSLDFKKLAKVHGTKRAAMVTTEMAERLTGYRVGGISPFGIRKTLGVAMDKGLLRFDKVAVNAGKRGSMLIMAPADILRAADAELLDL